MVTEINVLLIEDNIADAALIREMLKEAPNQRFNLYNSQRLNEGLENLKKEDIDVILLDLNLPDSHGLETFKKAKEGIEIPIVILSAYDDEDAAIKAVKGEAQDYLIKGNVDSNLLSRSISYAIERKSNEVELLKYRDHLEEMVEKRTHELKEANIKLQKEIEERKRAEEEIKSSLLEKKILLEEIHNRVENNLETISNLIGLEYSGINNKEPIEIYHDSQNRVKAIALIHERLSRSEDFGIIDFAKYTKDLVDYLFKTFTIDSNQIKVNINTNGILLDIDTAVPCGLIINELVTNSIKHAFPSTIGQESAFPSSETVVQDLNEEFSPKENLSYESQNESIYCPEGICKIDINLSLNQNDYILEVKDNGVGMPNNFNFRYSETTGMQMVNALVRQLDGLIDLNKGDGVEFRITFREFNV
ncbi:MAG: histidine kinase dimerization/phosphoacceptor domain -containing protein [Methanobacterium sp.]